ncbi:hypothetical protein F7725_016459 [Dissostichus mawsoni]|uniref:Uncharacterized protein n=1 Tax=Dissostichus mawsoni TaxID=36200 RepID=A0A7J5Z2C8_DISMA|nr:hypothetical protein F7725_016459 [Dissostichus mawsoni]
MPARLRGVLKVAMTARMRRRRQEETLKVFRGLGGQKEEEIRHDGERADKPDETHQDEGVSHGADPTVVQREADSDVALHRHAGQIERRVEGGHDGEDEEEEAGGDAEGVQGVADDVQQRGESQLQHVVHHQVDEEDVARNQTHDVRRVSLLQTVRTPEHKVSGTQHFGREEAEGLGGQKEEEIRHDGERADKPDETHQDEGVSHGADPTVVQREADSDVALHRHAGQIERRVEGGHDGEDEEEEAGGDAEGVQGVADDVQQRGESQLQHVVHHQVDEEDVARNQTHDVRRVSLLQTVRTPEHKVSGAQHFGREEAEGLGGQKEEEIRHDGERADKPDETHQDEGVSHGADPTVVQREADSDVALHRHAGQIERRVEGGHDGEDEEEEAGGDAEGVQGVADDVQQRGESQLQHVVHHQVDEEDVARLPLRVF